MSDNIADTLSAAEAAKILGVSTQTIRVRIERGELAGFLVRTSTGKSWRVIRSGALAASPLDVEPTSPANLSQSTSLAQVSAATLPQPGVVEALALYREERDRNIDLVRENIALRELLAARSPLATKVHPLAIAEAATAPASSWMERLDRWWFRVIGVDREPRAST